MGIMSFAQPAPVAQSGDCGESPVAAAAAASSAAQQFPLTPNQAQKRQGESKDLDALGKRKGKGKGLACWACLDKDHPRALCQPAGS